MSDIHSEKERTLVQRKKKKTEEKKKKREKENVLLSEERKKNRRKKIPTRSEPVKSSRLLATRQGAHCLTHSSVVAHR